MATCKYCGKVFRTDHNLENHQLLSHRDKATVTWTDDGETAPARAAKKQPPPPPPDDNDDEEDNDEDFWGTD